MNALSDAVSQAGGNWEQSHLAELAGKFAGILLVTAPAERAQDVVAKLREVAGLLDVTVQEGEEQDPEPGREFVVELVGNDHPGIIRDISAVFNRRGVSIGGMTSDTRDAPMSGERLFEARITAVVPADSDPDTLAKELEALAGELLVDLSVAEG